MAYGFLVFSLCEFWLSARNPTVQDGGKSRKSENKQVGKGRKPEARENKEVGMSESRNRGKIKKPEKPENRSSGRRGRVGSGLRCGGWPIGRVGGIQSWGLCARGERMLVYRQAGAGSAGQGAWPTCGAMDMVRRRRYPWAWPVALHGQGLYIILYYAYAFVAGR